MRSLRLLLPLLFLLPALPLRPQIEPDYPQGLQSGPRIWRLDYRNNQGERGCTWYHYDTRGHLSLSVWMLEDGSRHSINRFTYTPEGKLRTKDRVFPDGITATTTFTYDSRGRLIREAFRRSDGQKALMEHTYDALGGQRLESRGSRVPGWPDLVWRHESRGQRDTHTTLLHQGKKVGTQTRTWAPDGLSCVETLTLGAFSQTLTTCLEAEGVQDPPALTNPLFVCQPGWRIQAENYTYSDESGGPSTYRYDARNRLEEKTFTRSDGLRTRTLYLVSPSGRLRVSVRQGQAGKALIFTYAYDEQGRLIQRLSHPLKGEGSRESWHYDARGRLCRGEWQKMDGWLSGTMALIHDAQGRFQEGTFTSSDPGIPSAHLDFSWSPEGNMTRLHWSFKGSKAFQTYTLQHEPAPEVPPS